jgi:hypothetical protein
MFFLGRNVVQYPQIDKQTSVFSPDLKVTNIISTAYKYIKPSDGFNKNKEFWEELIAYFPFIIIWVIWQVETKL